MRLREAQQSRTREQTAEGRGADLDLGALARHAGDRGQRAVMSRDPVGDANRADASRPPDGTWEAPEPEGDGVGRDAGEALPRMSCV